MKSADPIFASCLEKVIWVRVEGKGSFQNSGALKYFAQKVVEHERRDSFVVDLGNCEGMDSTFMGTLTGIALSLQKLSPPVKVEVINASAKNIRLLEGLGLTQIFDVNVEESVWHALGEEISEQFARQNPLSENHSPGEKEHTEIVLEAHEALGEISKENQLRFKNVVELLKEKRTDFL